jgi:TRAP-type C4-dicarboxylate transport system permease large subunit
MILFIVAGAAIFGWLVTIEQVAIVFYEAIQAITTQKWLILLLINAILLFLGCFIEGIAIMIISVPTLIPVMKALQVSLVHFGVIVVLNIMIGLITPPMGMSLYIVSDLAKVGVGKVIRAVLPFLIPLIVVLLLTTYFPKIVLWIPHLLFKYP